MTSDLMWDEEDQRNAAQQRRTHLAASHELLPSPANNGRLPTDQSCTATVPSGSQSLDTQAQLPNTQNYYPTPTETVASTAEPHLSRITSDANGTRDMQTYNSDQGMINHGDVGAQNGSYQASDGASAVHRSMLDPATATSISLNARTATPPQGGREDSEGQSNGVYTQQGLGTAVPTNQQCLHNTAVLPSSQPLLTSSGNNNNGSGVPAVKLRVYFNRERSFLGSWLHWHKSPIMSGNTKLLAEQFRLQIQASSLEGIACLIEATGLRNFVFHLLLKRLLDAEEVHQILIEKIGEMGRDERLKNPIIEVFIAPFGQVSFIPGAYPATRR